MLLDKSFGKRLYRIHLVSNFIAQIVEIIDYAARNDAAQRRNKRYQQQIQKRYRQVDSEVLLFPGNHPRRNDNQNAADAVHQDERIKEPCADCPDKRVEHVVDNGNAQARDKPRIKHDGNRKDGVKEKRNLQGLVKNERRHPVHDFSHDADKNGFQYFLIFHID